MKTRKCVYLILNWWLILSSSPCSLFSWIRRRCTASLDFELGISVGINSRCNYCIRGWFADEWMNECGAEEEGFCLEIRRDSLPIDTERDTASKDQRVATITFLHFLFLFLSSHSLSLSLVFFWFYY